MGVDTTRYPSSRTFTFGVNFAILNLAKKRHYIMRKILFIICWALAGVGLYSCSLDEPSYGKTTSDNIIRRKAILNKP